MSGEFSDAAGRLVGELSRIGYFYGDHRDFLEVHSLEAVEAAVRSALDVFAVTSQSECIDGTSLFVWARGEEHSLISECSCDHPQPRQVMVEFKRGYYLDPDCEFFVSVLFDRVTYCPVEITSGGSHIGRLKMDLVRALRCLAIWFHDVDARFEVGLLEAYRPLP